MADCVKENKMTVLDTFYIVLMCEIWHTIQSVTTKRNESTSDNREYRKISKIPDASYKLVR